MIQRIQSVYLLCAIILLTVFMFTPIVEFLNESGEMVQLWAKGIVNNGEIEIETWSIFALTGITILLSLVALFIYKRRTLQLRLVIYSMLLMLGLIGLTIYYSVLASSDMNLIVHFKVQMVTPLIVLILLYLAFRGIRKDDLMVQAADRLR